MNTRKHIWITGGGRGIGEAAALLLGQHHNVTISGRNEASLRQVAHELPADNVACVPCDVGNAESVAAAYRAAVQRFGPIDVLVNNAGIAIYAPLVSMSIEDFDDLIAVNLRGVFLCTKAVIPSMIERTAGLVITVNSVAALTAFEQCAGYGASKAGALALSRSLRQEVRAHNVKVTDIFVGATDTAIWAEPDRVQHRSRMMQATDIAESIAMVVNAMDNPRTHFEEIVLRPQFGDL